MTVRARRYVVRALLLGLLCAMVGAPAWAQAPQQPPRSFRGLFGGARTADPNRTRQELALTANATGGYDSNLVAGAVGGGTGADGPGGYLGSGSVDVHYFRGRLARSFAIDGNAFVTKYGTSEMDLVKGGSLGMSATTPVRRRDHLTFSQSLTYDPLLTLDSFATLDPIVGPGDAPETGEFAGLAEEASFGSSTGIGYQWEMSRRNALDVDYGFETQRYLGGEESPGNALVHRASTNYTRSLSRNFGLRSGYTYSYVRARDVDGIRPVNQHTIEGGPQYTKNLSRRRSLNLSAGVGASYVRTVAGVALRRTPVDYWVPFGSASLSLDLSNNWTAGIDYERGTSVLPEVTTDSYVVDVVSARTSTLVAERLELDFNAGYSTGTAASATGSDARYRTTSVTATAQWAFSNRVAALVNYYYYDYQFTNTSDLPPGFVPATNRHTVRVGVTLWLPLLGHYVGSADTRP